MGEDQRVSLKGKRKHFGNAPILRRGIAQTGVVSRKLSPEFCTTTGRGENEKMHIDH